MAQDLERFEQGRLQRSVLPGGLFHDTLEQASLLDGGLLKKQLTCPARQAKQVDGLVHRSRRVLLDILNPALQTILLPAQSGGLSIKKLLADPPIELVRVHRLNASLDLVVSGIELLDALRAGRLLSPVRVQNSVTKLLEDGRWDDQLS